MDAPDYSDLRATFINCTLKRSPELSHTEGLVDTSAAIMMKHGVGVEVVHPSPEQSSAVAGSGASTRPTARTIAPAYASPRRSGPWSSRPGAERRAAGEPGTSNGPLRRKLSGR